MIKAILYDTVENKPINRTEEIDPTILPVGLNPIYKYYIPYDQFGIPDYDSRYFIEGYKETPLEIPHPLFPIFEKWLIEHPLEKRPLEDIHLSVDNAEKEANNTLKDDFLYYLSISALIKQGQGLELLQSEIDSINQIAVKCAKIRSNHQLAIEKKALIALGELPDIDALWERE